MNGKSKAGFSVEKFDRELHPSMDVLTDTGKLICR